MATEPFPPLTPLTGLTEAEYLQHERSTKQRLEYFGGLAVFKSDIETAAHQALVLNLVVLLHHLLGSRGGTILCTTMKVKAGRAFYYPDVLATCHELRFHDEHHDVVLNPNILVEVTDALSEDFDRSHKFRAYTTGIPGLTDYVLCSSKEVLVEHFAPTGPGSWEHTDYVEGEKVPIACGAFMLSTDELYETVFT